MSSLKPFWKWLEARPSRTAVMAEWCVRAGAAMVAVQPMLQPLGRPAIAYPNPRRGGLPLKIVHHRDGSIIGIDDEDWQNRLRLHGDDVVLYRLDLRVLRKTPVNQAARCLQVGNWEPKKAASFPVRLLLYPSRTTLRQEVLDFQSKCTRPGAILLTPTQINWDDNLEMITRSRKMQLVTVAEIVEADGPSLRETPAWEEYLQAFAQMVRLELPSNYRNKKPNARRASLMAKVEKVKNAMVNHIRSARDGVVANIDAGNESRLVCFLSKTDLAKIAGLEPYHITRCFDADPQLKRLYQVANDPEELLRFGK